MRAGRLAEIFSNEEIVIVGASGSKVQTKEYRSEWNLYDFVHRFPNTEIVKLTPIANNKLMPYNGKSIIYILYFHILRYL